jgi:hypothetical protein
MLVASSDFKMVRSPPNCAVNGQQERYFTAWNMRPLFAAIGLVIVASCGDVALGQTAPAALPPQPLSWYGDPGSPNLSGVWIRTNVATGQASAASKEGWAPWVPPLRGKFAEIWKKRLAEAKAGTRTDDPVTDCLPAGMPRYITGMNGPLLIVQTPGRVVMTREYGPPRRIWLDGRSLPSAEDVEQFFSGNSVGHYDGATMVVDTIGVKDEPIDATGVPHSDQVVIQERYHRVDERTLSVEVLVTDKLALSKPIRTVVTYEAVTDPHWELQELTCVPRTGYHPELFVK